MIHKNIETLNIKVDKRNNLKCSHHPTQEPLSMQNLMTIPVHSGGSKDNVALARHLVTILIPGETGIYPGKHE